MLRHPIKTEGRTSSGTSEGVHEFRKSPSPSIVAVAIELWIQAVRGSERPLPSPWWEKYVVGVEGKRVRENSLKVPIVRNHKDLWIGR